MAVVPRCTCDDCTRGAPPVQGPAVFRLVQADLAGRDAVGRAEYGDSLRPETAIGTLREAYAEVLDLAQYLRAELYRREGR